MRRVSRLERPNNT